MKSTESLRHEERGLSFMAMQDVSCAIEAFECAVRINAARLTSWKALERLYRLKGDSAKAEAAAQHLATLNRLPAAIVEAGSLFADGEWAAAESVLRAHLRSSDRHIEALRLLGRILHQRHALEEAERLLEEVTQLAPRYLAARADYTRVLIDQQKYRQAREQIASLLEVSPHSPDYLSLEATICAGLLEHERAIDLYERAIGLAGASGSGWAHLHLLLGNSLKALGRQQGAIESYRAAVAARPGFGDAYWSLANLKTYRFATAEIAVMRAAEAAPAAQVTDRYALCFALGKAFEDQGDYATSWIYYERGNALKYEQCHYRPEDVEADTRKCIETYTAEYFAAVHAGCGTGAHTPDADPIFIVGLPRSGSTLVEQILASHSRVEGTGELPFMGRMARALRTEDFRGLGERYLTDTRPYRTIKPFFIDKMPNNFRHIGLIHLMLPNAKIIDVRREPMACCFSNLKQLFASGQEFTYSIESIARYYRTYLELMQHWDTVLPGRVIRVWYEDVIEDIEGSARRLLQQCGLDFEPGCIEYYRNARSINTASSEQVRQPIFNTGLSQWRHYEPWLGPLKDALGNALECYLACPVASSASACRVAG